MAKSPPKKAPPADEAKLWEAVTATVKPQAKPALDQPHAVPSLAARKAYRRMIERTGGQGIIPLPPLSMPLPSKSKRNANTLDAAWDRDLALGKRTPDRTIDLHGHSLSSAHTVLDSALGDAIRGGARLIVLVTGRPARDNPRLPPTGRGVIRASVEDWLLSGPYASRIAAIRPAHGKHGGAGALYVILRRERMG
jgi:DNA-nicking Smr family endonuclease